MIKVLAAAGLAWRFLRAAGVSGVQTLRVIVRHGVARERAPNAAFIRMRYPPMSAHGASLLGAMISLTPGTSTLEIDTERHELVLHLLDADDAVNVVADIRRDFEPGILALFGERAR